MTLILSCITDDCVFQVSDRRLTSFHPPRAPIDDESNKVLFVNGRVAFGYTGISQVNGERTDLWLTRIAATARSTDLGSISRAIQSAATEAFRKMTCASRFKRQAFQGVGWFSDPDRDGLRPGVVTIENALDPRTANWLSYARPTFDLHTNFPVVGRHQFWLHSVGLMPAKDERGVIYQLIRACAHRDIRRQQATLRALVMCMQWLAGRYEPNSPIGPNLMAVSIPRAAAEQVAKTGMFWAMSGGPEPNMVTFLNIGVSGRAVAFGPHVVHGGSSLTNFQSGPIAPKQNSAA